MSQREYKSWGGIPVTHSECYPITWPDDSLPSCSESMLAYGLGRSYGDSCLNDQGAILETRWLDRLISFDEQTGVLRCESGVSLDKILEFCVPKGWFLPVTPGTKFVTVGGAIANDVHGKNHHRCGTWGEHTLRFELLRSDGSRLVCSPTENKTLFRATIGGLGLTGLITWAETQLRPIKTAYIATESIQFRDLDEFNAISDSSDADWEYTVAWLDCLSKGRGVFMRGNHTDTAATGNPLKMHGQPKKKVPINAPNFTLNGLTVALFNALYYYKQGAKQVRKTSHYDPFFYPLDSVLEWNRIYGKRGFFQYQCVVPPGGGLEAMKEIVNRIAKSKQASFLAVIKKFADRPSAGMLSFPKPGITLALDFPNNGERTQALFEELDAIVRGSGGILYPAKDARMSASDFQAFYPKWREFAVHIDPKFDSSFWRRVTQTNK